MFCKLEKKHCLNLWENYYFRVQYIVGYLAKVCDGPIKNYKRFMNLTKQQ